MFVHHKGTIKKCSIAEHLQNIPVSDLLNGLALGPNELAVEPVLDHQILFLLILHLANHPFQFLKGRN